MNSKYYDEIQTIPNSPYHREQWLLSQSSNMHETSFSTDQLYRTFFHRWSVSTASSL